MRTIARLDTVAARAVPFSQPGASVALVCFVGAGVGSSTVLHDPQRPQPAAPPGSPAVQWRDAQGRVGGQMVKGDIYVLGAIDHMLPGFKKIATVEKEVDGANYRLDHYVGDLGERHPTRRGEQVLGNLYVRVAA